MSIAETEKTKTWFENFKVFSKNLLSAKLQLDIKKFKDLSSEFETKQKDIEVKERSDPSNYNVFYLIKYVIDKEEITHSPFLADLLNINGKHKQGGLFFNEFIKQLCIEGLDEKFAEKEKMFFSVITEKWTGDGSIDIFVEYNSPFRRFAIAIENKIFAKDQPNQLERYVSFLEREFGKDFLLLYLTPNERSPQMPYSIDEIRFNQLYKNGFIRLITYQKHITLLLENTIPKIQSEQVKYITKNYLQIIKTNFTNGHYNLS